MKRSHDKFRELTVATPTNPNANQPKPVETDHELIFQLDMEDDDVTSSDSFKPTGPDTKRVKTSKQVVDYTQSFIHSLGIYGSRTRTIPPTTQAPTTESITSLNAYLNRMKSS